MQNQKARSGAKQIVTTCSKVKSGESAVLITDNALEHLAAYFIEEIEKITNDLTVINVDEHGGHPFQISEKMLEEVANSDVSFIFTQYFQSEMESFYTPIGFKVTEGKTRMVLCLDLNEEIMETGMNCNHEELHDFSVNVAQFLKGSKKIHITTEKGTDLYAEVSEKYKWVVSSGVPSVGEWTSLPGSEVYTTPISVDGQIVIDGIIEEFNEQNFGLLEKNPITINLKNGYAIKGSVESSIPELKKFVDGVLFDTDDNSMRVGEFAFGTNIYLEELIGNLSQDEKFPSFHLAFGDPHGSKTGASWNSKIHMDAIILKPTVNVDGKILMEDGIYKL